MRPNYPTEVKIHPRPIYPRPVPPKPFEYNPQIVSNKLETTYDAVEKIKENYKDSISKVKTSLIGTLQDDGTRDTSGVLNEIQTAIEELNNSKIAEVTVVADSFSSTTSPSDAAKSSISKCSSVYEKAIGDYVAIVKESAGKVSGLILNTKNLVNLVADEVNPLIINDLWSTKDDKIAKLTLDNEELKNEITVLETELSEIKARNKTLEETLIAEIKALSIAQDNLNDEQTSSVELLKDAIERINAYYINTVPIGG